MPVQFARAFRYVRSLIAYAFDVWRKLDRRNNAPQVRRDRLKPQQDFESILVDLFLQLIDLFVIRDRICAEIVIALQQTLEGSIQAALSQSSHH
jgi:hypothetical protein